MKILTVSDQVDRSLYDALEKGRLEGVELILSCGDLPPEYLTELAGALDAPLYYVRGNHDLRYDGGRPAGCIDANERIIRFKGINILGLDGSRWYNGGPNQYTESQMLVKVWRLRPLIWWRGGVDIIITHAPPRHIHDAEDPCHRGFRVYRRIIKRYAPRYFIHGHIHALFTDPGQRQTLVGRTRVVNSYGHYLFDIEHGKAD